MTPISSPLPERFQATAELIARGYGLTLPAATLLMLNAVGIAAGNGLRVRSIDYRDQPSGLNLAFTSQASLIRGALLGLLEPVTSRITEANAARQRRGIELTQAEL